MSWMILKCSSTAMLGLPAVVCVFNGFSSWNITLNAVYGAWRRHCNVRVVVTVRVSFFLHNDIPSGTLPWMWVHWTLTFFLFWNVAAMAFIILQLNLAWLSLSRSLFFISLHLFFPLESSLKFSFLHIRSKCERRK